MMAAMALTKLGEGPSASGHGSRAAPPLSFRALRHHHGGGPIAPANIRGGYRSP
ncbi:hypothetical protein HMPREF9946_01582 [Acetobacteraceae bacterium AT-5844]|nr:hypothetical protein HMPREF9946_01582 [Acetobacteraceae bacterium AT-5844]